MREKALFGLLAVAPAVIGLTWLLTLKTDSTAPSPTHLTGRWEAVTKLRDIRGVRACLPTDAFCTAILERQEERQQRLRSACESASVRATPRRKDSLNATVAPASSKRFIKVPKLGVTYCSIPKCASTTMKGFFGIISGFKFKSMQSVHLRVNKQLSAHRQKRQERQPASPFSLLVVRSPWARLVSVYLDKFVVQRHPLAQSCYKRHGMNRFGKAQLSFSQFVRCVIEDHQAGKKLNAHVAPMHWMCYPCSMSYSYIATVETLGEDFRYLSRFVFPPAADLDTYDSVFAAGFRRPNEVKNKTVKKSASAYASLTDHELDAIIRLYRPDALYYGYPERPE